MSSVQQDQASTSMFRMASLGATGLTLIGIGIGFIYLAKRDPGAENLSWLDAICRAAGLTYTPAPKDNAPPVTTAGSTVVWSVAGLKKSVSGDIEKGRLIAETCVVCHGMELAVQMSAAPHLFGMDKRTIYKEMIDYREKRRINDIMNTVAADHSDQDIANLAAFFDSRPAMPIVNLDTSNQHIQKLINVGDPSRNIVPCAACHGPAAYKNAAPSLFGLATFYIKEQLENFAGNTRQNDINRQMRSVARGLTPQEIEGLAKYYGEATQKPASAR